MQLVISMRPHSARGAWLVAGLWMATACQFDRTGLASNPGAETDAATASDAIPNGRPDSAVVVVDAMPPEPCEDWTYQPLHFDPCAIPDPQGALVLDMRGDYVYDTYAGTLTDPGGAVVAHASQILTPEGRPTVRLISVDSLTIGSEATLRAVGMQALLVASWSTIQVDGIIDVSSDRAGSPGAGADALECADASVAATEGGDHDRGGGGGGGGGFGGDGGDGGTGGDGNGAKGEKGSKVAPPDLVRGGCPGAKGGQGDSGDGGGAGGAGGGAIQLTARDSITVAASGVIDAGGAGGSGALGDLGGDNQSRRSGGGGGGSGGLVGLEAPQLTLEASATIAANGGGGGEGVSTATVGGHGQDGQRSADAATGGSGNSTGGDGGRGGHGADVNGANGDNGGTDRGGGGGGGGAGHILLRGPSQSTTDAVLSPLPTTSPLTPKAS